MWESTIDPAKLSPEAQKLIELTGESVHAQKEVDLTAILQKHPELLPGLNEYMQWRDQTNRNIEQKGTAQPVGHGISEALKGLGKPGK